MTSKVPAYDQHRSQPKAGMDWRGLALLSLTFLDLKREPGPPRTCLEAGGAAPAVLAVWQELVTKEIQPEDEEAWQLIYRLNAVRWLEGTGAQRADRSRQLLASLERGPVALLYGCRLGLSAATASPSAAAMRRSSAVTKISGGKP